MDLEVDAQTTEACSQNMSVAVQTQGDEYDKFNNCAYAFKTFHLASEHVVSVCVGHTPQEAPHGDENPHNRRYLSSIVEALCTDIKYFSAEKVFSLVYE